MSRLQPPRKSPKGDYSPTRGAGPGRRAGGRFTSLVDIAGRITVRDRVIAFLLSDHTALSTGQLTRLLFSSETTCRHRLYGLRRLGFIGRIARTTPAGRSQTLWVPGQLSARLVALARNQPPPTAKAVALAQDTVLAGQTACHTVEANEFFVDLLAYARSHQHTRLARWWPPAAAAAATGGRVHPDGHGVWEDDTRSCSVGFWLEYDRGTIDQPRLRAKLEPYRRLREAGGPDYPVLFSFGSQARERNFHQQLGEAAVADPRLARTLAQLTVATCARDDEHRGHPARPVWKPASGAGLRRHLADLPASHGPVGPLNPAAPTPEQHPLYGIDHSR